MIWRPKPGQRVVLRYPDEGRKHHGAHGVVKAVRRERGFAVSAVYCLVALDNGQKITVLRGNLFPEAT